MFGTRRENLWYSSTLLETLPEAHASHECKSAKRLVAALHKSLYGITIRQKEIAIDSHGSGNTCYRITSPEESSLMHGLPLSISHQDRYCLAALAHGAFLSVGTSIREITPLTDPKDIRALTPRERVWLALLSEKERDRMGALLLACKEAYIQAHGEARHPATIELTYYEDRFAAEHGGAVVSFAHRMISPERVAAIVTTAQ